jgi:2,3-bisphosphoglycerate-dependent phosphoglycerate mutase
VSSKGVGRVLNGLLGGQGRMNVGNGEIVEFSVSRTGAAAQPNLRVTRPHQA